MNTTFTPSYYTISCSSLNEQQVQDCSELYSSDYGTWSGVDKAEKKGKKIKLGPQWYSNLRNQKDMNVSLCYDGNKLIGHAFFLNKTLDDGKKCIWVTQLVVRSHYRHRGIAKKLLRSAWGMSDYFAWGLATTNAVTIKTLESVTWREVNPLVIECHLDVIRRLCDEIEFADKNNIKVEKGKSQIFTNFYPDFQKLDPKEKLDEIYVAKLGQIDNGCEWLAFTFQSQERTFNESQWNEMLNFSAEQLDDAYSRMDMSHHPWTKYAPEEVDYVIAHANLKPGYRVLDLGCGQGRHAIELAHRNKFEVIGVDLSDRLLNTAKKNAEKAGVNVNFLRRDARDLSIAGMFDAIICLYDVIGSYRTETENLSIINSIYKKLKTGGRCVVSVMNMELTRHIAIHRCRVRDNANELTALPASEIMQSSGNVFNPDFFLLDDEAHLVYRKEQFHHDNYLSSEYVLADYRFTKKEIVEAFASRGFNVISAEYVQTGHWNSSLTSTDERAKEILIVAEKP